MGAYADNLKGISLNNTSGSRFSGLLRVGSNILDCEVTGGSSPGLADTTCLGSSATLTTGISLATSVVGKIQSEDIINTSDIDGAGSFASISDWVNFDNSYRMWGPDGIAFPDATNNDYCGFSLAKENCRVWDWSISGADIGNSGSGAVFQVLGIPTGNNTYVHTWSDASTTTALNHAIEILNDDIGNDNGLCESSETCLYTPNIGSYSGHGDLVSAGSFSNGTIFNVQLMRFTSNGR